MRKRRAWRLLLEARDALPERVALAPRQRGVALRGGAALLQGPRAVLEQLVQLLHLAFTVLPRSTGRIHILFTLSLKCDFHSIIMVI